MLKSLRGGCWYGRTNFLLPSLRYWIEPDVRNDNLGFRLVREVDGPRVLRGGSWRYPRYSLRNPNRGRLAHNFRYAYVGLRLACEVDE